MGPDRSVTFTSEDFASTLSPQEIIEKETMRAQKIMIV